MGSHSDLEADRLSLRRHLLELPSRFSGFSYGKGGGRSRPTLICPFFIVPRTLKQEIDAPQLAVIPNGSPAAHASRGLLSTPPAQSTALPSSSFQIIPSTNGGTSSRKSSISIN